MAVAMIYPEPEKARPGKKSEAVLKIKAVGVNLGSLSQARFVLANAKKYGPVLEKFKIDLPVNPGSLSQARTRRPRNADRKPIPVHKGDLKIKKSKSSPESRRVKSQ